MSETLIIGYGIYRLILRYGNYRLMVATERYRTDLGDLEGVHSLSGLRLEFATGHRRDLLAVTEPDSRRFRVLNREPG